jgi:hypothetical protein
MGQLLLKLKAVILLRIIKIPTVMRIIPPVKMYRFSLLSNGYPSPFQNASFLKQVIY